MVCSPESQMTMWKPIACQADMRMIASSAVFGSPSQSGPWMPNFASTWLMSPFGWYMNSHSIDTTTIEVTTGRKYTVRKKFVPRILTLTSSANPSAHADCTGTMTAAKTIVLRSEAQNVSSAKSRTKLSAPMNSAGRGEMSRALVNASPNVSPIGMSRNVTSRTAAGSSMSSATVVEERDPLMCLVFPPDASASFAARRPDAAAGDDEAPGAEVDG